MNVSVLPKQARLGCSFYLRKWSAITDRRKHHRGAARLGRFAQEPSWIGFAHHPEKGTDR